MKIKLIRVLDGEVGGLRFGGIDDPGAVVQITLPSAPAWNILIETTSLREYPDFFHSFGLMNLIPFDPNLWMDPCGREANYPTICVTSNFCLHNETTTIIDAHTKYLIGSPWKRILQLFVP
jgi:hypothetical protein